MQDTLADFVCKRFSRLKSDRENWHTAWQDVVRLVRPSANDFNRQGTPGEDRTKDIYDGTARYANDQLASGLHSFLTNPAERYFTIGIDGVPDEYVDEDAREWLEFITDLIYAEYQRPSSNQSHALHEGYLDLGSFGTAVLNQEWDDESEGIAFRAEPLSSCFILEDGRAGLVDTLYRERRMSFRQAAQRFGLENLPPKMQQEAAKEGGEDKEFCILHAVYPRTDRDPKNKTKTGKKYASVWVCETTKETIEEGGYDSFPYHVPRWEKLAGETYGRSPALTCLPDIRMVNRMEMVLIKAGQKAVDPPIFLPDDCFMQPISMSPGAINFLMGNEPGKQIFSPQFAGNIPIGLEQTNQKREFILRCFYADWFRLGKDRVEMTALEVTERRQEQLRLLSPMLGRIERELLTPMIYRSYQLLSEHGRIPGAPESIDRPLRINYRSPASRAQREGRMIDSMRFLQNILPLSQARPSILDVIDEDEFVRQQADGIGVSTKIIRPMEEVIAMREQRQQAESMAQAAQIAEPASKAMKNIADANNAGGPMALAL